MNTSSSNLYTSNINLAAVTPRSSRSLLIPTKKDKIQQTPSSTQKNKVEAHSRTVKSSLKNKNCVVESNKTKNVQHSKLNANFELICVTCNGCMLSDNHDICVLDFINDVNTRAKSKSVKKSSKRKVWKPTRKVFTNIGYIWRPTGRTFTIVGNACPLTRITTAKVPLRKPTALESDTPKPVVTLVYLRKPRKSKTNVPVIQIVLWYLDSGFSKHMIEDRSQLTNFVNKFFGTVKFGNDHVAKIMRYGKSKKKPYKPKFEDTNQEKLYLLHMDLCGPMRVASVNGKKYILVIVDDYSQFTWVKCLRSKDEASDFIIKNDWDLLFQPLFNELLNHPPSVDLLAPEVIAPIAEVVAPEPATSTGSPSSTTVDQDAPSPSNSQTTPETQSPIISNNVEEENHDLDVAHMNNDPFFHISIPENDSKASSSLNVIPTIVHTAAPNSEHVTK
ncbi:retrovirus-related pol polyprotein from transposon TNT 1-94 [Tanacetum coccineum]